MLDKPADLWYTVYRKREEEQAMNWYMNPELHDEDFAELADLLEDED